MSSQILETLPASLKRYMVPCVIDGCGAPAELMRNGEMLCRKCYEETEVYEQMAAEASLKHERRQMRRAARRAEGASWAYAAVALAGWLYLLWEFRSFFVEWIAMVLGGAN